MNKNTVPRIAVGIAALSVVAAELLPPNMVHVRPLAAANQPMERGREDDAPEREPAQAPPAVMFYAVVQSSASVPMPVRVIRSGTL